MTVAADLEVGFYASRQVALMGRFALQGLYQGLWHADPEIQKQSAIILGWIGERESVESLLLRMGGRLRKAGRKRLAFPHRAALP